MLRYKFVEINPSTSGEKTVDALSGLGEKKRKIKQLFYVPTITTSATPAKDGDRIRAYKNQEQIVDFCVDSFNLAVFSGIYFPDEIKPIDLDLDLQRGEGFSLGLFNASSTPTGDLQFSYEDME